MPSTGDGFAGQNIYRKFTTRDGGVPASLAGSPVVSVYKNNSLAESTAGVTLIADFDGRTGLNHVTVDTSVDVAFYTNGAHYDLVVTAGTVGGTSVVAEVVGSFELALSIANQIWDELNTGATHNVTNSTGSQLRKASAGGGTTPIYAGTCPSQTGMTSTQIKLDAGASAVTNIYQYNVISIIAGTDAGDASVILSYDGATKIATVDAPFVVQPDATSQFQITPGAKSLVIDKTGFSLSPTGADLLNAGSLNGKGNWLTTLGSNAPAGWINAAAIAAAALNGKGDWLTTLGTNAPAGWINAAAIAAAALNGKGDWLLASNYTVPPTASAIAGATWDVTMGAHLSPGSTGEALALAASGGGGGSLTAADVWTYGNRTLTSLGATAPAGWINAAAIAAAALNGKGDWLTTLGTNAPAGWINAAAIAAAALNGKGDWLTATGVGADTPGTTLLLQRLTEPRAENLDFLDIAVSSRSDYDGGPVLSVTNPVTIDIASAAGIAAAVLTVPMVESYAARGDEPTMTQALLAILQRLTDFALQDTAITVYKLDGATSAYVLTLGQAHGTDSSNRTS